MIKKVVLLKDLESAEFPVVDILNSENEERLNCATTAVVNFTMKLNIFDRTRFSNIGEFALFYEKDFKANEGVVEPKKCFEVLDNYIKENKEVLEAYFYKADLVKFEAILFLLINNFTGLVCTESKDSGHCDVLFYQDGKVYFNAFEVNFDELAEIIFSSPKNMFCFARNLKNYKRFLMSSVEMGSLVFKLKEGDKYFLSDLEQEMLTTNMVNVFLKYPTKNPQDLIKEKEALLKNLGYLDHDLIITYPNED